MLCRQHLFPKLLEVSCDTLFPRFRSEKAEIGDYGIDHAFQSNTNLIP
jgi:hypothetical protein